MKYDFNLLEAVASNLVRANRSADAIKIYLYMADGDPSLDGGYLGMRLGECYERIGDLHAAKYWHTRAVEANPHSRPESVEALKRLSNVNIDIFLPPSSYEPDRKRSE